MAQGRPKAAETRNRGSARFRFSNQNRATVIESFADKGTENSGEKKKKDRVSMSYAVTASIVFSVLGETELRKAREFETAEVCAANREIG
ncbi:hypothetical protein CDAR_594581 [Caerostris darwini]|uniref:Uncharacterized protein n=1 Tax=Caerostris darwini TaxID=1538125 RepID=A0AAV4WV60_9ARAC|nr:hypothetical protein CDAR_594581 [Caerostris darwini]